MPFGQIEPLNFVVGRQLALNQNVDASTATRHGLVGAMLGAGILGPIIARELASRDARNAVPPLPVPVPPTTGTPGSTVDRMIEDFNKWIESQKNAEDAVLKKASDLQKEGEESRAKRIEALKQLCESVSSWSAESDPQSRKRRQPGEGGG